MEKVLIVGAGFSGAVIANILANNGIASTIIDSRAHIGGNCFTEVDDETGITVHRYGPHIFHTDDGEIWDFINRFTEMKPFVCRVKATSGERVYSLPINLHTINQFYGETLSPSEAEALITSKARTDILEPKTFEDQALRFVGPDLYEAFFKGYPLKQWGLHPSLLPASVLKRLPVRFNYEDNYFSHKHQGIPANGYTPIFDKLTKHENIEVKLRQSFSHAMRSEYSHVFFSGTLDSWFDHAYGALGYRTLDFEKSVHHGDFQGCAVMSYPQLDKPFTRITEHKHFTPWASYEKTVVFHEYSRSASKTDEPFYPIRLAEEQKVLSAYIERAEQEKNVSFVGRLGTYRYIDMDVTIKEAIHAAATYLNARKTEKSVPVFFTSPR